MPNNGLRPSSFMFGKINMNELIKTINSFYCF